MGRLFGTDGIRGVAKEMIGSSLVRSVGRALVDEIKKEGVSSPKILIGMDTRHSSEKMCEQLLFGIGERGGEGVSIGVCSTPAVAFLVRRYSLDAGIMISASHNPYNYNGIKIFGGDGFKLSDEMENAIERRVLDLDVNKITPESAKEEYINYLISNIGISLDGLKIGIDCANGSASATAKELFSKLGAECYVIFDRPDGMNINKKCGSTDIDCLKRLVLDNNLDIGIAFDGDADRCIAVDENGEEADGDFILAILASRLKRKGLLKQNTLVGTVMTNLGLKKFCEQNGIDFISARVGDRYVLEKMNDGGYSLGGEQSGHLIMRELATTGDGQLTALALLSEIKESGKSLSEIKKIMQKYPQITVSIPADSTDKFNLTQDEVIKSIIADAEGLLPDGRIIIRPSGTEDLIRIMVEGESADKIEIICKNLSKNVGKRLAELKNEK